MNVWHMVENARNNADLLRESTHPHSPKVLLELLGPAYRGLVLQKGKGSFHTEVPAGHSARFNWRYGHDHPELARLYEIAKKSQWNATTDLDWSEAVDPFDESKELMPAHLLPLGELASYRSLPKKEQAVHRKAILAWMLSQFLHGEQAALLAACQVTEAVDWIDGKLYGSTQVVDEGRHVEVFHRYLTEKLEKKYEINDNLYVLVDSLLSDGRWDLKFLGMQIMVEGLALGAFGVLRQSTKEPLLRELLKYVITDEARHVHYGVVALADTYARMPEKDRREREDWAYEVTVLMRNRFLAHEFYEEYYAHVMSRREWNEGLLRSAYMQNFRRMMFKRLIPNLKRVHLLSDRVRPYYADLGLLEFENERAAPDLTAKELIADSDKPAG